jgi:hypothetical protein
MLCPRFTMFSFLSKFSMCTQPGADPGFQVRGGGGPLKKLRRAGGGGKILGYFV